MVEKKRAAAAGKNEEAWQVDNCRLGYDTEMRETFQLATQQKTTEYNEVLKEVDGIAKTYGYNKTSLNEIYDTMISMIKNVVKSIVSSKPKIINGLIRYINDAKLEKCRKKATKLQQRYHAIPHSNRKNKQKFRKLWIEATQKQNSNTES